MNGRSMGPWAGALVLAATVTSGTGCGTVAEKPLPLLPIGGAFELLDHDGERFCLAALAGKVVLIFFGYSSCPDACPTTLSKLAAATRRLGDEAANVRTLYISVDPERDTPPVLKADLANFTLDARGLTGTKAEIDDVVRKYGAFYAIVPTPESVSRYSVSHSTSVYGLDREGRVRLTIPYEASVEEVVQSIRSLLAQ